MRALAACGDRFQCDCRGVGTDWAVDELSHIASALMGTVDIVPDPTDLDDHFAAVTAHAMEASGSCRLAGLGPPWRRVRFVRQTAPALEELTGRRIVVDEHVGRYPTGAWGTETRDYHLCIELPSAAVGTEMLAARVSVLVAERCRSRGAGPGGLDRRRSAFECRPSGREPLSRAGRAGGERPLRPRGPRCR